MNIFQLKLSQLKYFMDVAETGSFTKAAEKNFTSQSNVSYAMRELEKTVGLPLFIRRNNELTITRYGETFLPYVQKVFSELDSGCEALEQLSNPESGAVKIAFSYMLSLSLMPELFRHIYMVSSRDGVQADLQPVMLHAQREFHYVEELLLDGTCDLGITMVRVRGDVESVVLGKMEHVLLLPKNHPLANSPRLALEDVKDEPFVLLNSDNELTGNFYRNLFTVEGIAPNYIHPGMDWLSLLMEVSAGKCLTIAPKTNLSGYDIAMVPLVHPNPTRELHLAWPTNRKLPRSVQYVKQQIIDYFKAKG